MSVLRVLTRLQTLMIVPKEVSKFAHGILENLDTGEIYHTEVIGLGPVEATSVDKQDLLITKQIKCELLIVHNAKLLHVDLGENVERCLRLHRRDSGNVVQRLVHAPKS